MNSPFTQSVYTSKQKPYVSFLLVFILLTVNVQARLKFTAMCWKDIDSRNRKTVYRIINSYDSSINGTWMTVGTYQTGNFTAPRGVSFIEVEDVGTHTFNWEAPNGSNQSSTNSSNNNICSSNDILPYFSEGPIGNVSSRSFSFFDNPVKVNGINSFSIRLKGSGMGIMGNNDHFQFAYFAATRDAQVTARLLSFNPSSASANGRTGIMIRQGLGTNMPYVALLRTTSGQIAFQFRTGVGMGMTSRMIPMNTMPVYLRLRRTGNLFEAFTSMDGENWMKRDQMMVTMNMTANYGLAISSADQSKLASADFDNVMVMNVSASCDIPMNRFTSQIQNNMARINWDPTPNAMRYEFRYRMSSSSTWISGSTANSSMNLTNLMMNTNYMWQVRTVCNNGLTTNYSASTPFKTLAMAMNMPSGMIGNWPLNNMSGTIATDMRNGNDGVLHNFMEMPWMMDAINGRSLRFDGVDDYVAIKNLIYQGRQIEAVSVALWLKTVMGRNQILVSFDMSEYYRLEINGTNNNTGKLRWSVNTESGRNQISGNTRIDDGNWHFVVATFDKGLASLYVDGQLEGTRMKGTSMGSNTNPMKRRFGFIGTGSEAEMENGERGPHHHFAGNLDEVRIYNSALSAMQVQSMYMSESGNPPSSMNATNGIFMEAECAMLGRKWVVRDMPSGMGQYVSVKDGNNAYNKALENSSDRIRFNVPVGQAGMYNLFFRVQAPDDNNDSYWVRVNGNSWVEFNNMMHSNSFIWDQVHNTANNNMPMQFRFEEGMNTLDVAFREDGTLLDKVYITMESQMPMGAGPIEMCNQAMFDLTTEVQEEGLIDPLVMNLFPNPASDKIYIAIQHASEGNGSLSLLNLYGQLMKEQIVRIENQEQRFELNTENLAEGIYFIKFKNEKHDLTQRVVISR